MVLAIPRDDSACSSTFERIISPAPDVRRVSFLKTVSEDILLNIFCRLEDDPRHLARLACVCRRFSNVIRDICWKQQCVRIIPDVLPCPTAHLNRLAEPAGGWGALMRVLVCCPGLKHAGIISECGLRSELQEVDVSDSGRLTSEIHNREGPESCKSSSDQGVRSKCEPCATAVSTGKKCRAGNAEEFFRLSIPEENGKGPSSSSEGFADLTHQQHRSMKRGNRSKGDAMLSLIVENVEPKHAPGSSLVADSGKPLTDGRCTGEIQRIGIWHSQKSENSPQHLHFTSPQWNLSRELGSKLLASRFWSDSLYVCDWPGCVHPGDKRIYKVFRGFFKNFKTSLLWRSLKDMKARPTDMGCAFCSAEFTWDMMPAFCLRRSFEYHDDGEPVVHANVCENGHMSGAWTDRPGLYAVL